MAEIRRDLGDRGVFFSFTGDRGSRFSSQGVQEFKEITEIPVVFTGRSGDREVQRTSTALSNDSTGQESTRRTIRSNPTHWPASLQARVNGIDQRSILG
jgi:hypothetical protein